MKKVRVEEAIGQALLHDITKVIPGEFKGVAFKKGHIIEKADIDILKSIGKEHVYIGKAPDGYLHEEECAVRIAKAIADIDEFEFTDVSEGKINILSRKEGLLKINRKQLLKLNNIEHISISTKFDDVVVKKGEVIASERIIPLYTKEENISNLERICKGEGKLFKIKEFIEQKVHLIITGNEIYEGRIQDKFLETLEPKIREYGCKIEKVKVFPDNKERIKMGIQTAYDQGAEIIICTGGMSVDEDDLTPIAIKESIDELIIHGVPVQPGNMFLLGYKGEVPVLGIPGSVMYFPITIFDMIFPKIACKERIKRKFFMGLGFGGLCNFCSPCHYPNCTFLKGR